KIARSTTACPPVALFSMTTCRWITLVVPGSDFFERIVQSACAVAATARRSRAALRFATVFGQQGLKIRIVSQRIPNRTYLQNLDADRAWPVQQSVQDINRAPIVPENSVDFSDASGDLRPAKGVLAFRLEIRCPLRLGHSGFLFTQVCEHFCQLDMELRRVRILFELVFGRTSRPEEGCACASLVLQCLPRKADVIILAPQAAGVTCQLIVGQSLRYLQSILELAF